MTILFVVSEFDNSRLQRSGGEAGGEGGARSREIPLREKLPHKKIIILSAENNSKNAGEKSRSSGNPPPRSPSSPRCTQWLRSGWLQGLSRDRSFAKAFLSLCFLPIQLERYKHQTDLPPQLAANHGHPPLPFRAL
mgnify:CR=1 FL=1